MDDEGKGSFQRKAEKLGKDLQSCGCALLILAVVLMIAMGVIAGATERPYASQCLNDAAIDQAVGDQVRAGAFFIDTSRLPDRPLCSGLTLAQQIQRIRAAAFPEEKARAEAAQAGVVAQERAMAVPMPVAPPPGGQETDDFEAAAAFDSPAPRVRRTPVRRKAATRSAPARGGFFASCSAARAAGAAPIRRGQAGYSRKLDRDGDGIACE